MLENHRRPILYIGESADYQQIVALLEEAGFDVDVKVVPRYHHVAVRHGLPVLFGLSGRFEGIEGIGIFIENATMLGYGKQRRNS